MAMNESFKFDYPHEVLGQLRLECWITKAGDCRLSGVYGEAAGEHYTQIAYRHGVYTAKMNWLNKGARLEELLAFVNSIELQQAIIDELWRKVKLYDHAFEKAAVKHTVYAEVAPDTAHGDESGLT